MKYIIIIIFTAILVIFIDNYRIKKIKSNLLASKASEILYSILSLSFEKEPISKSSKKIINALRHNYGIDYCSIYLYSSEGLKLASTNVDIQYMEDLENYSNDIFSSLKNNEAQIRKAKPNYYLTYDTAKERNIQYSYFILLKNKDIIIGALHIENKELNKMGKIEEEFFNMMTQYITVVFQNLIYYDQIVNISITDSLTGAYNKGYLKNKLKDEIELRSYSNSIFSIVMMDLDNFKKVNDTYGHPFGDIVLKELVRIAKETLNKDEFIARYGGEEFVLFLNCSYDEAFKRVEKLRERLSNHSISDNINTISITGSFGISQFPIDGSTNEHIIESADKAAYFSKKNGKNRVTLFRDIKGSTNKNE